jgi:hypothetical protein
MPTPEAPEISEDAWRFIHRGHAVTKADVEGASDMLCATVLLCETCDAMLVLSVKRKRLS